MKQGSDVTPRSYVVFNLVQYQNPYIECFNQNFKISVTVCIKYGCGGWNLWEGVNCYIFEHNNSS